MHRREIFSKKDWIILLAAILFIACFAILTRKYFMDDAYIGFTFLRNLKNGNGFVFYPGQLPIEGVTNIGWILLLWIISPIRWIPITAKVLGFVFIVLSIIITYLINKEFTTQYRPVFSDSLLLITPIILIISGFDFLYFSLSGMETAFLTCILLSMTIITIKRPDSITLSILGCLAFLVRPEAILVYFLFLLFAFLYKNVRSKKYIFNGLFFGGLIGLITLGRYLYFGSVLPNTFVSKQSSLLWIFNNLYKIVTLKNTSFPFPFSVILIFVIPLLFIGAIQIAKRNFYFSAMSISCLITGIIFCIYAPADWTGLGRYFSPYFPFLIFWLWIGILSILRETGFSKKQYAIRNGVALGLVAILSVTGIVNQYIKLKPSFLLNYPGYVLSSNTLIGPSIWMRSHLPANAIIASRRIGVLSYFSGKQVFDYKFGLTESDISYLVHEEKRYFDSPNDFALASIWTVVKPGYILEDETDLLKVANESGGSLNNFKVQGIVYHEINRFKIGNNVYWVLAGQE